MALSCKNAKDIEVPWTAWFLYGSSGCITGDAMIGVNRASKGGQMRLDHLVKMFNGGRASGRVWDPTTPTMIRARLDDGTVRLVRLLDAYASGTKPVFEVSFETGHKVRATRDHRFLTTSGWKRLEELTLADLVFVEPSRIPGKIGRGDKKLYHMVSVKYHPYAARGQTRVVPMHRVLVEAQQNKLGYAEFIRRCRIGDIKGLTFLDPRKLVVHHKDRVSTNNALSNLQVMTHAAHKLEHGEECTKNFVIRTAAARVVKIVACGEQATYDLALDEPHNFLANGVVVHNSGKTTAAATFPNPVFLVPKTENSILTLRGLDAAYYEVTDVASKVVNGRGGMTRILDELINEYKADPQTFPYETIVLESVSHYSDLVQEHITGGGKVAMDQQKWGLFTSHFRNIHTRLRDLQCHIVYTALADLQEKKDGTVIGGPLLSGASRLKLPSACDGIGYCETFGGKKDTQEYRCHFQKYRQFDARTRFKGVPAVVAPFNFAEIEQHILQGV